MDATTGVKLRCIMIGGTGATGLPVVRKMLELKNLEKLTVLVRKENDALPKDERLHVVVVDFDHLADRKEVFAGHNCLISTMGTTKSVAGTAENYRKIEVEIPNTFATLAKETGCEWAVLMSSQGADPSSFFTYLAQKGEVEQHWKSLEFKSLTILQPGLLDRGKDMRTGEKIFAWISKPIHVDVVAAAIVHRLHNVVVAGVPQERLRLQNPEIQKEAESSLIEQVH